MRDVWTNRHTGVFVSDTVTEEQRGFPSRMRGGRPNLGTNRHTRVFVSDTVTRKLDAAQHGGGVIGAGELSGGFV